MSRITAYTSFVRPGLHLWREGTDTLLWLKPASPPVNGWVEFDYDFEPEIREKVVFLLFGFNERGDPAEWELSVHRRELPRDATGSFAPEIWSVQGAGRVLTHDPRIQLAGAVRIHLISARRYRPSELFLWDSRRGNRRVSQTGSDVDGPIFDVELEGTERAFVLFKFIRREDAQRGFVHYEPDIANRLWHAHDGNEIWVHSDAAELAIDRPIKQRLRVNYWDATSGERRLYLWQQNADFSTEVSPLGLHDGWRTFEVGLYTRLGYGFRFFRRGDTGDVEWEHEEAVRVVVIESEEEVWTVNGDRSLFRAEPSADHPVELMVALQPPFCRLERPLFAHVWVNRSRSALHARVPVSSSGRVAFLTFPDVVTSLKFFDAEGTWETLDRHTLVATATGVSVQRHVVLDRPPLLQIAPPGGRFADPPFEIRRPGVFADTGALRFAVHAPTAARVRLIGEWTGWENNPIEMRSTRDGSYWWASVGVAELHAALERTSHHGVGYCYLFDDGERLQDPAAGWVNTSWTRHGTSRLIDSGEFAWTDQTWRRPGWEYLNIYQIHVARFTNRDLGESPLVRVRREIESPTGYLRGVGATALMLLPLNEVGTKNSWGYDPAYFYAIEESFGGPDALKALVNACHAQGIAVIVDVVFNHAGSADNILWEVARESFFDGDTKWGAMINFDHPQCRHFFAQNLVYLAQEYHIDGFRLDHTATIVHSNEWNQWSHFVRVQGTGGGWEFLHALRNAVEREVGPNCLLMAEHLPNEWALTNCGGPMDTQWSDDFHDRLIDACRGDLWIAPRLAAAMELSHAACENWHGVTNYPESHDEVGNVRDRVAYVAGLGRGWRMGKVAAAATLLARGIPMTFMGTESGEDQQFEIGGTAPLDLDGYEANADRSRLRAWWRTLSELRRGNASLQGPAPLRIHFAEGQILAYSRGEGADYFVVLNFGGGKPWKPLGQLGLPEHVYRELWNSTWPAFAIVAEREGEHTNGGREARLDRNRWVQIPDYGVIILQRV